ncbi:hypothetical protein AAFM46_02435 [Arthrobacter sp. TMP15]|uniref:hypothetical protein n=1 Tax=Arthrobacter sp. TMP15 TaxID=3140789 RepID=UPI0031BA42DA
MPPLFSHRRRPRQSEIAYKELEIPHLEGVVIQCSVEESTDGKKIEYIRIVNWTADHVKVTVHSEIRDPFSLLYLETTEQGSVAELHDWIAHGIYGETLDTDNPSGPYVHFLSPFPSYGEIRVVVEVCRRGVGEKNIPTPIPDLVWAR